MPLQNPSNRLFALKEEATNSIPMYSRQPASKIKGSGRFKYGFGEDMVSRSFHYLKSPVPKSFRPSLTISSSD